MPVNPTVYINIVFNRRNVPILNIRRRRISGERFISGFERNLWVL
jgi:hypothetical protein